MKIVISIFCLPHEIDDLEQVLLELKKGAPYLSGKTQWVMDVTVCDADDMVDWKKSSLPKSYFFDKLARMYAFTDWCSKHFQTSSAIKGSLAQKRYSLERNSDADYFIWLDSDIVFDHRTLSYIEKWIYELHEENPLFFMTPEIVRWWDTTWDCLVNEQFLQKPLGYQATNDPFVDCGIKGEVSPEIVVNNIPNQPRFKFGSGIFLCISRGLMKRIGIPASFGQYGLEDTFMMFAADKLSNEGKEVIFQFKLKNLVVCENYRYRRHKHYLNHLSVFNRKEEFKKISQQNFDAEVSRII